MFHCEWNPFGQRVLKHYWPNSESYGDITKTDFTKHNGAIDILTGGFPCQPYSTAGKRKGKEDARHLWPEMLRAIGEIQPTYIVGENVSGLTNWNGGMVFNEVQAELEAKGYEVAPFLLPACGLNAPHRRERIWFIAYSSSKRTRESARGINESRELLQATEWQENKLINKSTLSGGIITNTNSIRRERRPIGSESAERTESNDKQFEGCNQLHGQEWQNFPTKPPVCGGDDGLPRKLDGITFPKWRAESIKAYGNAIVPQVAFEIFKAIEQTHILNQTT
jgi:DNA (cytosine-5)-methyltransferase 1